MRTAANITIKNTASRSEPKYRQASIKRLFCFFTSVLDFIYSASLKMANLQILRRADRAAPLDKAADRRPNKRRRSAPQNDIIVILSEAKDLDWKVLLYRYSKNSLMV